MNILIIEDEINVSSFIKKGLEESGYEVLAAFSGEEGIKTLKEQHIELIILDIILPDINGFNLCEKIRNEIDQPLKILMLTALNTTDNIVQGLNTGADDYLGKPFEFKELTARIKALSRRDINEKYENIVRYHDLELNTDTKEVKRRDCKIQLTAQEYNLLNYFLNNKERVITRLELMEHVWEVNFDLGTNIVDVYVNYLRKKIDKDFKKKLIHTKVGMGYILIAE